MFCSESSYPKLHDVCGDNITISAHTLARTGTNTIPTTHIEPTRSSKFECIPCNYNTVRKSQYDRHTLSTKHINTIRNIKNGSVKTYKCQCNKQYLHHSSLWNHKKKCNITTPSEIQSFNNATETSALELPLTNHFVPTPVPSPAPTSEPTAISHDIMYAMFKELCASNAEFKQMIQEQHNIILDQQSKMMDQQNKMMELSSKIGSNNNINNNSNNNTQVNVNMFLNEYCKDAVTLTKFIESIKPSFEDVMYMSDKGNVAGLTKILKTALGGLAITDRPLHCTDVKRHTTWVKEADGWQKDQEQANLKRLCNKVEHACLIKTMDIIQGDENYLIDGTAEYEHVHKMMLEAGGGAERHAHNIPIVVRNIEENIKLDKEQIQEAVK